MRRQRNLYGLIIGLLVLTMAFDTRNKPAIHRPLEVWAIRSVLDGKPRMLTIALDSALYVAYDMAHCTLYKAWKGGIAMDGAPYTGKKEVQPTSWGTPYVTDSTGLAGWAVERDGKQQPVRSISRGYQFRKNQIYLSHRLVVADQDTVQVEERPEFVRDERGRPGLERTFTVRYAAPGLVVSLDAGPETIRLAADGSTRYVTYFAPLPPQLRPIAERRYAHRGQGLLEKSDCFTCHELNESNVGPAFRQVAARYTPDKATLTRLAAKIQNGGTGAWGNGVMNPHPALPANDVQAMLDYIFTLKPKQKALPKTVVPASTLPPPTRPGSGLALAGVHPGYSLTTLSTPRFTPKVGAMAFRADGRLLVTTWDEVGGVYLLDGVTGKNPAAVRVKRIGAGLAEPLGITVVDGEVYVLQKQELTQLIDHDGDEVIDEYRTICNGWDVTADFHEFAFGLVYKNGYFYATLSMAMRLKPGEEQLPDRGRTIKISRNGQYESVNFGLRTPNGIGKGVDDELFVLDNQGQWLPANKLIHVRPGDFNGMGWGWLDDSRPMPPMVPPAIWLPEDEIGNSPSEPVLISTGVYKGQLLHGDVTHGGIKRDFLEKINGRYQGAVFRFSQGLAAGVNRLRWGPDGSLYVGEVGMKGGGWSWQDKTAGLQKLTPTGKQAFEMLAVRARPNGFEIEFTQPVPRSLLTRTRELVIQQWGYQPTPNYGGPKTDLTSLSVAQSSLSANGTKLYLEIGGLKAGRVVYFRLPDGWRSAAGQLLWSTEAWYTLNAIPESSAAQ